MFWWIVAGFFTLISIFSTYAWDPLMSMIKSKSSQSSSLRKRLSATRSISDDEQDDRQEQDEPRDTVGDEDDVSSSESSQTQTQTRSSSASEEELRLASVSDPVSEPHQRPVCPVVSAPKHFRPIFIPAVVNSGLVGLKAGQEQTSSRSNDTCSAEQDELMNCVD